MAKKVKYEIKSNELKELTPVTVGELKKQKGRSPLIIIMFFMLFICFVVYLPDIVDYISGDNEEPEVKRLSTTEEEPQVKENKIKCSLNNISFDYYFTDNILNKIEANVTYEMTTERYSDYLEKYNTYKDKYNLVNGVTSTVTENETGFIFNTIVTYPNDEVSTLKNYAFFDNDISIEDVKAKMALKQYTCSE